MAPKQPVTLLLSLTFLQWHRPRCVERLLRADAACRRAAELVQQVVPVKTVFGLHMGVKERRSNKKGQCRPIADTALGVCGVSTMKRLNRSVVQERAHPIILARYDSGRIVLVKRAGGHYSGMPNQALEQTRDSVLRCG